MRTLALVGITLLLSSCSSDLPPLPEQPNFVFILIDTLRASDLSYNSYTLETSPNLDALARESYVFENAVAVGGNTPTAMAGIMTGLWPHYDFGEEWAANSFGMRRFYRNNDEFGLPEKVPTLTERMRSAGYATAGYITNPYVKKVFHFDRGFDVYGEILTDRGKRYGRGDSVTDAAVRFLETTRTAPFFLYLHYMDTHGPYHPPPPFLTRFADSAAGKAPFLKLWRRWRNEIKEGDQDAAALRSQIKAYYDGAIAYVDHCVAGVLEALKRTGLSEDTIIVVAADHGEEFLEHGGTTHKGTLYEEIVHVPLMIKIPGWPGSVVSELVRNFDLMPTILDFAGVETEWEDLDAVSLRGLIQGGDSPTRFGHASFPEVRMLRGSQYKLLLFPNGQERVYDLAGDPFEQSGVTSIGLLGSQAAEKIEPMYRELARLDLSFEGALPAVTAGGEASADEETLEQLRALGYLK